MPMPSVFINPTPISHLLAQNSLPQNMELCTAPPTSKLRRFTPHSPFLSGFPAPRNYGRNVKFSGLRDYASLSLRAASSDETSVSSYAKDGPDSVITYEETKPVEKEEEIRSVDKEEEESLLPSEEGSSDDNVSELFESFLAKLDIEKLDSDDKYSLLLLGLGGFTALYLATAVVGAIDSIPLLPNLMQVVGVSYTAWFTARYLVLKENREELTTKVKEIKEKILG